MAALGDHPAEALDTCLQVPYIARRFDAMARGQVEGPPQRLGAEKVGAAVSSSGRRDQQDERFLLERLGVEGSWILVEGEGGSGKTEFARHTCAFLAERMSADLRSADRIPVFVELRSIGKEAHFSSASTLMAALSEHAGALSLSAGETTWFHRLVDEGKVTLIADGLDEFPDPSMFDVFDRALEEARRQFGLDRCSVLVTGRPSAFALTPRLRRRAQSLRFQPQPLTLPEIEAGIADFFGEDRTASAAMTRAVAESRESVQRLLGIPLFLTLTCAFWSRGDATRILSDTSVLMAQGLEHLLARRLGGHVQRAMDDLARLAASACPAFDDIPHSVASQLVDEGALESYSRGSGILRGGPGTGYRFGIRPLAEYLAGRHVANAPDEAIVDLFSRHAWSNRWREPLFWMAGELWKRSRSTVALTLLDRVLVEVENDRDDLPQTLFQRTCDLIGAGGEMKELPETIISRLSRLLVPMKKNPYAADRIYRFEAQFRTWPSFLRDRLARDVVNAASRTYSHLTAEALGALRSEKGIETLVRLSKARGDDDIRQYTFGALGQIGTRRAIDFLVRELEAADSDGVQIEGIARALARAGARSAIPALVRGLDDPRNEGARGAVYDALADLGWDGSVPRILSDIERERTDAAGSFPQAFNILVRLASRTQEARRALERLTRDETDPYLQHIAANALGLENAITILLPDEISYPDMSFIAYTVYLPSELAGQFLSISREADPSEDRQIGKILARVARVDPELQKDDSGNEDARINWYHLVLIDTSDPERALDTLEFVAKVINEAGSLSSIAEAIGSCGSSRSSQVLAQLLDESSPRGVLYAAIDALGDPANRDAVPRIRSWLELERETDDDLAFHAAQTLLKIHALDASVVADCLDAEAGDAVIDAFRHHDHTAFVVPTRLVTTRFGAIPRLEHPLATARSASCVILHRIDLRLGDPKVKRTKEPPRNRRGSRKGSPGRAAGRRKAR